MRFSVCIPVYNAERFIALSIESVLAQTLKDFEIVMIDDGSSDNSKKICQEYARNYEFIKFFSQENQGVFKTRYDLSIIAEGEYCVFLDSDDTLRSNALEVLDKAIKKYEDPSCLVFGFARVFEDKVISITTEEREQILESKEEIYEKLLSKTSYNSIWRKCIRADVLKKVDLINYFHIRMGEDLIHSLAAYKLIDSIVMLPDVLYNYSVNYSSVTHTVNVKNFQPSYLLFNYVYDSVEKQGVLKEKILGCIVKCYRDRLVSDVICICAFSTSKKEKIRIIKDLRYGGRKLFSSLKTKLTLGRRLIYIALKLKLFRVVYQLARLANRKSKKIKTN